MALRAKIYMCVKKKSRGEKKIRSRKQAECCWGARRDMMGTLPRRLCPKPSFLSSYRECFHRAVLRRGLSEVSNALMYWEVINMEYSTTALFPVFQGYGWNYRWWYKSWWKKGEGNVKWKEERSSGKKKLIKEGKETNKRWKRKDREGRNKGRKGETGEEGRIWCLS